MVALIGFAAGILTTGCLIPQVWRTHRTQSTGDLSLAYLAVMDAGVCLWIVYGVGLGSVPIMVSNGIGALLISYLVSAKVRHRRAGRRPAGPGRRDGARPSGASSR